MNEMMEVLATLLEAEEYLAGLAQQGALQSAGATQLLEDTRAMTQNLQAAMKENGWLVPEFEFEAFCRDLENQRAPTALLVWLQQLYAVLQKLPQNQVDRAFLELQKQLKTASEAGLVETMKANYQKWRTKAGPEEEQYFIKYNHDFPFWGRFDPAQNQYEMMENRARCLKQHREDFEWLYYRLGDYRSKKLLLHILEYWLRLDPAHPWPMRDLAFAPYFDLDLLPCTKEEVFVDLGAFVGDTTLNYLKSYGPDCYKKIHCYELVEANVKQMKRVLAGRKNIEIHPKGVSSKSGTTFLPERLGVSNAAKIGMGGKTEVPLVALDDDIKEPITFLKMDIEGAEYDALLGARRHITENRPKLAISAYHSNDDLWRLARLIDEMCPDDYDFYLRLYVDDADSPLPFVIADYVLLGAPHR